MYLCCCQISLRQLSEPSFFNIFTEFILFTDFEKKKGEIPPVLEQYLKTIAKTGETLKAIVFRLFFGDLVLRYTPVVYTFGD